MIQDSLAKSLRNNEAFEIRMVWFGVRTIVILGFTVPLIFIAMDFATLDATTRICVLNFQFTSIQIKFMLYFSALLIGMSLLTMRINVFRIVALAAFVFSLILAIQQSSAC